MKMIIKARHLELDESDKKYIEEEINKLKPLVWEPAIVEVTISDEAGGKGGVDIKAEINIECCGNFFNAKETTSDIRGSIDLAKEKMEIQLRKHKEKVIDKEQSKR